MEGCSTSFDAETSLSPFEEVTRLEDYVFDFASEISEVFKPEVVLNFYPIPVLHDLIIRVSIFVLTFLLNLIIFCCYFRNKSDIAKYIRVFAVFDCAAVLVNSLARVLQALGSDYETVGNVFYDSFTFLLSYSMLGPLFLALDRFLIVSFPHNFQLHERKMRRFKIALFSLVFVLSWRAFMPMPKILVIITLGVLSTLLAVQFLGCIVLYTIIVVKLRLNDSRMKNSRHVGSRCVIKLLSYLG